LSKLPFGRAHIVPGETAQLLVLTARDCKRKTTDARYAALLPTSWLFIDRLKWKTEL